jgi:hypothetical protein
MNPQVEKDKQSEIKRRKSYKCCEDFDGFKS